MQKFTHYLVTRFNVPVHQWNKDKTGHTTLDDQWMQHRLSLFKKYCVPTIAAQAQKNFIWIIYCGAHTKTIDLKEIEEAVRMIPGTMIRTVAQADEMISDLKELLSNTSTPFVITSRVDNDDGLGGNYIKTIQDHFSEKDKLLLNLTGGIYYDVNSKVMTRMKYRFENHFTSLIEEKKDQNDFLTVLGFPHDHPPAEIKIENIFGEHDWLKIIHDRNVKSQLKGKPLLNASRSFFEGVNKKDFPISISNTLKYILKRVIDKIQNK